MGLCLPLVYTKAHIQRRESVALFHAVSPTRSSFWVVGLPQFCVPGKLPAIRRLKKNGVPSGLPSDRIPAPPMRVESFGALYRLVPGVAVKSRLRPSFVAASSSSD